ncbi:MAG: chromosomal replication initiator protein DnaA [Pseudomonadota bacterium]|jgi:chromosomal replication initiator protein|nr:chromosomal replication initiator protein DnaA [Alphaproteobacteria bacterium]
MAQPQLAKGIVVDSVERLAPTAMLNDQWNVVKELVAANIGSNHAKSWIEPLELLGLDGMVLVLGSPNTFAKDWIENHYLESLTKAWKQVNMVIQDVKIVISETQVTVANTNTVVSPIKVIESFDSIEKDESGRYTGAPLDNRFTFENFVVGKPNELAYAAALRVAESAKPQFNPLFLYGGVGLGKTHLMHAIAWKIRQCHPNRKVIYLSAEKFMYQFVRALRYKDMVAFKDQFRAVDVLMIDDVQFISGKDTTQEEFFHTFNALVDKNHQVIVSADKSPSDLENMEERLKSRLGWGLVADIHPTTYELRLGILQAKAAALNTIVPKEVLEFLAFKITSNIRELEGALNRILAHSSLVGRSISLDTTQEVLRDLLRSNDQRLTVEEIQRKVAEYFNIKMSDMVSNRRMQNIARPRQVAMYIAKQLTSKSLPEIGRKFGGRDHTTILHAVRKVQELCAEDFDFANDVEILKRSLQT